MEPLNGLAQAGSKVQALSEPQSAEPTVEEINFSHLGGKLVHRFEAPVETPDGKPIDFSSVYGEHGGQVLAP